MVPYNEMDQQSAPDGPESEGITQIRSISQPLRAISSFPFISVLKWAEREQSSRDPAQPPCDDYAEDKLASIDLYR